QGFKNFTPWNYYTCKKEVLKKINQLETIIRQKPTLDNFFYHGSLLDIPKNVKIHISQTAKRK
ncbi:hypothetical protein, partial [Gillisia hiemivivida]|uniref:hypothetical protein n=1 Tax=Gillisia hiemivivida TaxID=291190 RepID=UPI0039F131D1